MKLDEINVTKKEFEVMINIARQILGEKHQGLFGTTQNYVGYVVIMKDGSIAASYDMNELLGGSNSDSVIVRINRNGDEITFGDSDYDREIKGLNGFAKAVVMVERPFWLSDDSIESCEELEISGKTLDLIKLQKINVPIIYANGAGTKYFIFKNSESAVFKFEEENI